MFTNLSILTLYIQHIFHLFLFNHTIKEGRQGSSPFLFSDVPQILRRVPFTLWVLSTYSLVPRFPVKSIHSTNTPCQVLS